MNISDRNTQSKRIPEIDSLYVYKTRHSIPFTHRQQPGEGYRYTSQKAIEQASEDEIHIYHQTAVIDGVENGLTMVTKSDNVDDVEQFFKDSIEEIADDKKKTSSFKLAKTAPSQIGVYYTY